MSCFVFLDSWRLVPQKVQHLVIRQFAEEKALNIDFYGDELYGNEYKHSILVNYLEENLYRGYIFFSIHQFQKSKTNKEIDIDQLIRLNRTFKVPFYFALENICIDNTTNTQKLQLDIFVFNNTHLNSTKL